MVKRPNRQDETQTESGVATKPRPKIKKPSMYRVILLNDDFTPMDFVVAVLQSVFDKDKTEATEIMLQIHQTGIGICEFTRLKSLKRKPDRSLTWLGGASTPCSVRLKRFRNAVAEFGRNITDCPVYCRGKKT